MKAIAVYIYRNDGIPLFSRYYDIQAHIVDELVTPFLLSTTERMKAITGKKVKEISLDNNNYLIIEEFGEIICALLVGQKPTHDPPLNLVARRFYKKYHNQIVGGNWTGRIDFFDDFAPELEEILDLEINSIILKLPKRSLDVFVMTEYPKSVHHIIKLLIRDGQISKKKLNSFEPKKEIENTINELVKLGYAGIKEIMGEKIYFTTN